MSKSFQAQHAQIEIHNFINFIPREKKEWTNKMATPGLFTVCLVLVNTFKSEYSQS